MDTRTKEAVRYLGYGRHAVDDHTLALVESSFMELEEAAGRRTSIAFLTWISRMTGAYRSDR